MKWGPEHRIVFIYLVVGVLWIYISDLIVGLMFKTPEKIEFVQNVKGWVFVFATGVLLYFLINRAMNIITKANSELLDSYDQTMCGWIHVMDLRHKETKDHTRRVTVMTVELARLAGIAEKELKIIERGATLHDIGKIGIPDAILIKPGKLDEDEWEQIKQHPQIGFDILADISYLQPCIDIPYCHHEKWDGSGYPRGLKGEDIPISARLFAVIDVWDALSFERVYKSAWPEEKVLKHIREQTGAHFDPSMVSLFMENYHLLKDVKNGVGTRDNGTCLDSEKTSGFN